MNLKLPTAVVLLVLLFASFSEAQMEKLTEAQAVELAEKFIAQNGYVTFHLKKIR